MAVAIDYDARVGGWGSSLKAFLGGNRLIWLVLPAFVFFLIFFIVPVVSLFLISLDKPVPGIVDPQFDFVLKNFSRFFGKALYYEAAIRSVYMAALVALLTLILGYPLAYLIAKDDEDRPKRKREFKVVLEVEKRGGKWIYTSISWK